MKEKVTSFEISEKLHELGFESKTHCGWWFDGQQAVVKGGLQYREQYTPIHCLDSCPDALKYTRNLERDCNIKAYDCWDLLMWLQKNQVDLTQIYVNKTFEVETGCFNTCSDEFGDVETEDNQPQNALGLAVIKILEEKYGDTNIRR